MKNTVEQYNASIAKCKDIFLKKNRDYGSAWRILRTSSLTDQIFIKAQRIRTLEDTGENQVGEGIESEFIGIINYSAMALIQLELLPTTETAMPESDLINRFDKSIKEALETMLKKNHDYGEAWRDMRISSFTDLILMKLLRIKQIEDNKGKTIISEGLDANFIDIINYAVFALIMIDEQQN